MSRVTDYRLNNWGLIPGRGRNFSLHHINKHVLGMSNLFLRDKAA
jgi:hypothetical protein